MLSDSVTEEGDSPEELSAQVQRILDSVEDSDPSVPRLSKYLQVRLTALPHRSLCASPPFRQTQGSWAIAPGPRSGADGRTCERRAGLSGGHQLDSVAGCGGGAARRSRTWLAARLPRAPVLLEEHLSRPRGRRVQPQQPWPPAGDRRPSAREAASAAPTVAAGERPAAGSISGGRLLCPAPSAACHSGSRSAYQ